jgi:YrbI family 3-deoxy-D-manno-octulosonate 8-phosphate phosphatase
MKQKFFKNVALIPLRGGSKGIPRKNLKALAGKPLFQWTLEAALQTQTIDWIYVSTDDSEIRNAVDSLSFDRVTVVDRSPETATDNASSESVLLEFAKQHAFENLILIQATSPLLTSDDLHAGIQVFEESDADSLLSVVSQKRFLWKRIPGGTVQAINYDPMDRPRRQQFDGFLVENGAFYVSKKKGLVEYQNRLFGRIAMYQMPGETYFEIDEPCDWQILELLIERRSRSGGDTAALARDTILEGLRRRATNIKLFISDVDGVLTDSGMYYTENGDELKKFNTRDGKAFELLRGIGVKVGIITAEDTKIVERRSKKLGLDFLEQGAADKIPALERIMTAAGVSADQVAYIGDDLGDLPILGVCGMSFCPGDATLEAKQFADYTTLKNGGEGCIREIVELVFLNGK